MFAVFRRRDFSLLWLAQLVSTAGSSLTDLAAGIFVWRATESALAVGLTLMVTAIPSLIVGLLAGVYVDRHDRRRIMIATCLIQAVTVGLIAVVIGIESIALIGLYVLLLFNAGVKQFFDPGARQPHPGDRQRRGAGRGQLVPVDRVVRLDRHRLRRGRPAGRQRRAAVGVHPRCRVVPVRGRLHRADGPLPDAQARRGRQRPGHRRQPEVRAWSCCSGRRSSARCSSSARSCSSRSGCGTSCSCRSRSRSLGATEFQYGLQEGLTSVGFVVGSFFMARFSSKLPGARLDRAGDDRHGHLRRPVRPVELDRRGDRAGHASPGFLNSPSSVSRSVLLQRNTPREMRGRVFSSFYVMRDVVFLVGMAGAGLADIVDIRLLIVVASSLLFVSAAFTLVAPGLGISTWGAAAGSPAWSERGAGRARAAMRGLPRWRTSISWPVVSAPSPGSIRGPALGLRPRGHGRRRRGRDPDHRARRRRRPRPTSSSTARRPPASRSMATSRACRP